MVKFEDKFYEKTKVVLFEETVTAASAAMLTFQRGFLNAETISLDHDTSSTRIRQSSFAGRYLAYLQTLEQQMIQTANNIGEFKVPNTNYTLDGYIRPCAEYPKGLAIKVNGCYWHACSCSYAENQVVFGTMRAVDIRKRDEKRREEINQFCDLRVHRECDIIQESRTNAALKEMLKNNKLPGPIVAREALFGGRTEPIRLYANAEKKNKKMYYLDFTSLYPFVMKSQEYPVGEGEDIHGKEFPCPIERSEQLRCRGYMSVRIEPPAHVFLPVLPLRTEKLLFPLCRKCGEESLTARCTHSSEERAFYGTYTTVELEWALKQGYRITHVYAARNFKLWSRDLFKGYINAFLKCKQEASGYPDWAVTDEQKAQYIEEYEENEGIRLDPEAIRKDEVERMVMKLLLNSLWGKFAQREDVSSTEIVTSPTAYFRIMNDPTKEIIATIIINDETLIVQSRIVSGCLQPLPTSAVPYAAFTTAYARVELFKAASMIPAIEENLLYMGMSGHEDRASAVSSIRKARATNVLASDRKID